MLAMMLVSLTAGLAFLVAFGFRGRLHRALPLLVATFFVAAFFVTAFLATVFFFVVVAFLGMVLLVCLQLTLALLSIR